MQLAETHVILRWQNDKFYIVLHSFYISMFLSFKKIFQTFFTSVLNGVDALSH